MAKDLFEALKQRRSYYRITNSSPVTDERIEEIVRFAATYVPSPFNSQSTRLVLLLGEHHQKLWNIVKEALRKRVAEAEFPKTEEKINSSFLAGYGSVLFFEDESVVSKLQNDFSGYKDNFPVWSNHTNAMHQLAVWTMLEAEGFGASLQHYNPLIDEQVKKEWNLSETWKLVAQMPFGMPLSNPDDKTFEPIEKKVKIFSGYLNFK